MSKTFTLLSDVPAIKIDRCAQMLPNRLQCWRPGYYLVSESPDSGGQSKSADQGQASKQEAASKSGSHEKPPGSGTGDKPEQGQKPTKGGSQDQPPKDPKDSQSGEGQHPAGAGSGGQASATEVGASAIRVDQSSGSLTYQLCAVHKIVAERAQEQASKEGKSVQECQDKIMGEEQAYRLTHMPIAKEERPYDRWGRF